jgi:hypothetical protein
MSPSLEWVILHGCPVPLRLHLQPHLSCAIQYSGQTMGRFYSLCQQPRWKYVLPCRTQNWSMFLMQLRRTLSAFTHTHTHTYKYTHKHTHIHKHPYKHIHIEKHTHIQKHTYKHTHTETHTHTEAHIQTHTHTHRAQIVPINICEKGKHFQEQICDNF